MLIAKGLKIKQPIPDKFNWDKFLSNSSAKLNWPGFVGKK
jgi:hypothetical protein